MHIAANITGIKYTPFICRKLTIFNFSGLDRALSSETTFIVSFDDESKMAVSWWVSSKRTRSYPYARVYDSLGYMGKRATVIPIMKDEGKDGDRDFLQWDTVSLMSLLGIYVVIGYYENASRNLDYRHKITDQRYDIRYIREELLRLLSYQSDALHWNLSQLEKVGKISEQAIESYMTISKQTGVHMHSVKSARKRINKLLQGKEAFLRMSRDLAQKAQKRESVTFQPLEKLSGTKATITITNYLGGVYYFTCDEVEARENDIFLIEGKHTKSKDLPSLEDIKDGLLKMILLTSLKDVRMDNRIFHPIPILKLTTGSGMGKESGALLDNLKQESIVNGFRVTINSREL